MFECSKRSTPNKCAVGWHTSLVFQRGTGSGPTTNEEEVQQIISAVSIFNQNSLDAAMKYEPARPSADIPHPRTNSSTGRVAVSVRSFSGDPQDTAAKEALANDTAWAPSTADDDLTQGLGVADGGDDVHRISVGNLPAFLRRLSTKLANWIDEAEEAAAP